MKGEHTEEPVHSLEQCSSDETLSNSRSKGTGTDVAAPEENWEHAYAMHVNGHYYYWSTNKQKWVLRPGNSIYPNGRKLPRHYSGLWLAMFFAALTIVSWTFTCFLTYRPLYASGYQDEDSSPNLLIHDSSRVKNMRYYRASRVLESIINVLTIPVATAVCVKAAVTYTQKQKHRVNARKALVLADRGWTSISTFWKMVWSDWRKKNLTSFLVLASLLTILGFTIAPVKSVLVTQASTKTPSIWTQTYSNPLTDWTDLFHDNRGPIVAAQLVGDLRGKLFSTPSHLEQPYLWVRSVDEDIDNVGNRERPAINLLTMIEMAHPFMCQLPNSFNTGLLRQYAPRLNSTVEVVDIGNTQEWPQECGNSQLNFYRRYLASDGATTLEFCMPGNLTSSPWTPSRDRQDISESLLVRVSTKSHSSATFLRVDASTTFGFFELPNFFNGNIAGPVLEKAPHLGNSFDSSSGQMSSSLGLIKNQWPQMVHPGMPLEHVVNRGPLLTTVLALFGDGSLLALASQSSQDNPRKPPVLCEELYQSFASDWFYDNSGCGYWSDVTRLAHRFSLTHHLGSLEIILERALFLANEVMITGSQPDGLGPMVVNFDQGLDSPLPTMSLPSMIVISSLLALFLIGLFSMAIYSCTTAHWTGALDAFAILRVGATAGDKLHYQLGQPFEQVTALDEIPCWVGDASPDAEIGEMSIGAEAPLKRQRTYTLAKTPSDLT